MIYLILFLILSLAINVILIWYARSLIKKYHYASEAASSIFTQLSSFKTHLKSLYELELFYGDRNLKEIIEHTKDLIEFLKRYDGLTSFTQPELAEILEEETTSDNEEKNEQAKK